MNQKNNDRHLLQADYHLRSKHCHRKLETKGDRIDPSVWINGPELRSEGKYECNRSNMIRSFHFVRSNLEINLKSLDQDLALFQFREGLWDQVKILQGFVCNKISGFFFIRSQSYDVDHLQSWHSLEMMLHDPPPPLLFPTIRSLLDAARKAMGAKKFRCIIFPLRS